MTNHSNTSNLVAKTKRRAQISKSRLSRIKSYVKRAENLLSAGACDGLQKAFIDAQSEIMKGVARNVLKKNTAARMVKALAHKLRNVCITISD